MITAITLDLAIARNNTPVNLGAATTVRFHQVPAAFTFGLDAQPTIPCDTPFTVKRCDPNSPYKTLYLTNPASSGNLVVLYTTGEEIVGDFLANLGVLLSAQSILTAESAINHGIFIVNNTNPQDAINPGDAGAHGAIAAGLAGQNFDAALVYYGGLWGSVAASAAAQNGGQYTMLNHPTPNLATLINAMQSTAIPYTRSSFVLARSGLWAIASDVILETVVNVAGSMVAVMGIGFEGGGTTVANGLGGTRGMGIAWSNQLPNNNWWLIATDGTNITAQADTGVLANGLTLRHLQFEWGFIGSLPVMRAVIDGQVRAVLAGAGIPLATLGAMAAATLLPRWMAQKIQAGQATNNVRLHAGGYTGLLGGRVL